MLYGFSALTVIGVACPWLSSLTRDRVLSTQDAPIVSGMFMLCYGVFRFGVEFVRVPDAHIGFIALDWVTMGHLLSAPMILFGLFLLTLAYSRRGKT